MAKLNKQNEYGSLSFSAAALKAMGDREYQEDTYIILKHPSDPALLAMVADGMGGMQDGRHASRTAVSVVKNEFLHYDMNTDAGEMLREGLKKANEAIYSRLHNEGGSTAIACVFKNGYMHYAGVGDSFLMLRRGSVLYHLNLRQNVYYAVCMAQVRRSKTDRGFAEVHPERSALTGYLGAKELREIDSFLKPLPLMYGDCLLLCSDGVGDALSDEEILKCLSASTPDEACRRLDDKIIAAGHSHQDNYTAVVVKCE